MAEYHLRNARLHRSNNILLALLVLCIAAIACGSSTPTASPRCVPASPEQVESIRDGIKDIDNNNDVLVGFAVRSDDFENVWMVAVEITGAGIQPNEAIGIWAISGDMDNPGLILSVNGFAKEFSSYPDASKTDARITISDDGANDALSCAKAN